ncbi:hypothetical protein BURPS1710A_A3222 [Burkholderia pseudomallei 1710a]|uniref:Uncharacterized protein n=1 Tax=Burkholderia pseudomallei 1710a TaxID=320371 RepID=A0A0E1W2U9_BURPE|nr:hypothetical protein BURPS1710A_A3222 [Burkholderia pseudomallei 1710a]
MALSFGVAVAKVARMSIKLLYKHRSAYAVIETLLEINQECFIDGKGAYSCSRFR